MSAYPMRVQPISDADTVRDDVTRRIDTLAHSILTDLGTLKLVVAHAIDVEQAFQIWERLRVIEEEAMQAALCAGAKVNALCAPVKHQE